MIRLKPGRPAHAGRSSGIIAFGTVGQGLLVDNLTEDAATSNAKTLARHGSVLFRVGTPLFGGLKGKPKGKPWKTVLGGTSKKSQTKTTQVEPKPVGFSPGI